jgi:formate hydrogenlyase subunit 4
LFHKEVTPPETASWIFWATPIVAFICMLTVPILIPVLTNFPLPLSDMGDILGGGLILTLGSFMIFSRAATRPALMAASDRAAR